MRNKHLTAGMHNLLWFIRDSDEEEVVYSKGGGWWVDITEVSGRVVKALLKLCLLRDVSDSENFLRYTLNEESIRVLDEPNYEPMMIEHLRTKKPVYGWQREDPANNPKQS